MYDNVEGRKDPVMAVTELLSKTTNSARRLKM
jgi:hypothetical protein